MTVMASWEEIEAAIIVAVSNLYSRLEWKRPNGLVGIEQKYMHH